MEEGETVSLLSRKEQRKQKLMEYLAAKGKLNLPNPKPYLHDTCQVQKPLTTALKAVKGKENKAPASKLRNEGTKVQAAVRRAFDVTNKVNVKGRILARRQNDNCQPATGGPAQPKLPVLRSTHTVISSKSNLNAAMYNKKQPNTRMQSSAKTSSNAGSLSVITSNTRFSNISNAAPSGPVKTLSVRMSLGPLVRTKTGLIPAVTQSSNTNSHLKRASVADKVVSSTSLSLSISQRSAMVQRKTPHTTGLGNCVKEKTAVCSIPKSGKVQAQNNLMTLLVKRSQPSFKSELASGVKSTSMSSKCKAAPIKPEGKMGMSKPNQSVGQPADRSTKPRCGGEKNGHLYKAVCQTSLRPPNRCSSRTVSGSTQAAVIDLGGKTMTCNETKIKKGHISANVPPQQMGIKRAGVTVMSQTVPQPARTFTFTRQAQDIKMPKVLIRVVPQTEGRKVTGAQEERMRKLQEWREAKGISYKRPPMPVKPQIRRTVAVPQPFWTTMKEEDEAHSLICAVDRSLADCIKLLGEGCPSDQVKEVVARLPAVSQKFAKYWICQARLMEQEGNLDVLPMFEEAVRVVLEPVDELRNVVFEILKKKEEIQESDKEEHHMPADERTPEGSNHPVMTPKPVRALVCGERGDTSVVKYKITATPGGPPSQQREPIRFNSQEVRFFTPVRRSVRIERASLRYPVSLQDHDLCVASYNDLISKEDKEKSQEQKDGETTSSVNNTPMYIYRQNEALKDKVFVQLFCDEGD